MRLLLVDDEPRVLSGLGRVLVELEGSWEVVTATSGELALERMAEREFDVVVTDMRMPGFDGADLLAEVQHRYPGVTRIVLSGQPDEADAIRALAVAHRFLAKPCSIQALRAAVEGTASLRVMLADPALRAMAGRHGPLPSPPKLYAELQRTIQGGEATTERLAAIVRRDPAAVAKVLQVVNSAFFSRGGAPVTDPKVAVVRLGVRLLASLVLAGTVFSTRAPAHLDVAKIQRDAERRAAIGLKLASGLPYADSVFVGCMLADVGLLIDGSSEALTDPSGPGGLLGAYLLGLWGLPFEVIEAVANTRRADRIHSRNSDISALVHVAEQVATGQTPDPRLVEGYGLERILRAVVAGAL